MRTSRWLPLVASFVMQSPPVQAEEAAPKQASAEKAASKQPSAEKAPPDRVHLGATSVTVVDEGEKVDDVITRVRNAKSSSASASKAKQAEAAGQAANAPSGTGPRQDGRADLRRERENEAARPGAGRSQDGHRELPATVHPRSEKKQRR
jgi:hypothetical protein